MHFNVEWTKNVGRPIAYIGICFITAPKVFLTLQIKSMAVETVGSNVLYSRLISVRFNLDLGLGFRVVLVILIRVKV